LILSVDASLPILSAALTTDDRTLGAVALEGRESRNEKLLPAVDWLLRECGVERNQIQLFVVTRGPGSFTGVRIGLATISGLAFALGKPVCALSTHEAAIGSSKDGILVYSGAGRGELYGSGFDGGAETFAPTLLTRDELEQKRGMFSRTLEVEALTQSSNLSVLAAERARAVAASGRMDHYRDLTPIYVRLAEAEVKLRQGSRGC
jgi:tRNA threonylcarbamoyl adenosine modification protein YeaZ